MFSVAMSKHGARVSPLLGTSKPEHVSRAVIRALRQNSIDVPVNPGPMRIIMALNQLAPGSVAWVQDRLLGVNSMLRDVAQANRSR
jgi:hypothetical protein